MHTILSLFRCVAIFATRNIFNAILVTVIFFVFLFYLNEATSAIMKFIFKLGNDKKPNSKITLIKKKE